MYSLFHYFYHRLPPQQVLRNDSPCFRACCTQFPRFDRAPNCRINSLVKFIDRRFFFSFFFLFLFAEFRSNFYSFLRGLDMERNGIINYVSMLEFYKINVIRIIWIVQLELDLWYRVVNTDQYELRNFHFPPRFFGYILVVGKDRVIFEHRRGAECE